MMKYFILSGAKTLLLLFICILKFEASNSSIQACQISKCSILNEDYCYYFGNVDCYRMLCHCALDCQTSRPYWCSSNAVTQDEETVKQKLEQIPEISLKCHDLLSNCNKKKRGHVGHCFFYDKNCHNTTSSYSGNSTLKDMDNLYPHMVSSISNKKRKNRKQQCLAWKTKCQSKYPKHFACRQYKKHCDSKEDLFSSTNIRSLPIIFSTFLFFYIIL